MSIYLKSNLIRRRLSTPSGLASYAGQVIMMRLVEMLFTRTEKDFTIDYQVKDLVVGGN